MNNLIDHLKQLKLEDWRRNTQWFELYLYSLGYDSFQVTRIIDEFYSVYYGPIYMFVPNALHSQDANCVYADANTIEQGTAYIEKGV